MFALTLLLMNSAPFEFDPRTPPALRYMSVELPMEPVWGTLTFEGFLIPEAFC